MDRMWCNLGLRRLWAALLALVLMSAARALLSGRPPGYDQWHYAAQRSAAHLVVATYGAAFGIWVVVALSWVQYWLPYAWLHWFPLATRFAGGVAASSVVWTFVKACGAIGATPPELLPAVTAAVFWAAVLPLLFGLAPFAWVEAAERLRQVRWLQNWLTTGRGAHASWIAPYDLKKLTQPMPRRM